MVPEINPRLSHTTMKRIFAVVLLILILPAITLADLEVHFLDVGQGDCAVVMCDGETMVIDGGPKSASEMVYSYLRNSLHLRFIDYVVSTHPHVDHCGGLPAVTRNFQVDLLLTPVLEWDSNAFRDMIGFAKSQGTPVAVPETGDTLRLGSATVTILYCWPDEVKNNTNNSSIVLRVDYVETSFLFTGDAEDYAEYLMLIGDVNLKADVLKVAHHGSSDSSSEKFLRAVSPEYAVISAGRGNKYGHPHRAVLERLRDVNAKVLRTDERGTVIIRDDGKNLTVVR